MSTPIGRTGLARTNALPNLASGFPHSSPKNAVFFDHFLGDILDARWNVVEGTDGITSDASILAGGAGGVLRFTTGDTGTGTAADMVSLNAALQYKANAGGLSAEAKVAISAITDCYLFFGFTDTVAFEAPIEASGTADGLVTTATDAVGIMFDTRMATDTFWLTAVKADVDAVKQNSAKAPVAATSVTLRVEVTKAGAAAFYINGVMVGSVMENAISPAALLTPVFAFSKTAGASSITADVDYVGAEMKF